MQQAVETLGQIDILVNNTGARGGRDRVPVVDLEEAGETFFFDKYMADLSGSSLAACVAWGKEASHPAF